jgi:hypothetical protein
LVYYPNTIYLFVVLSRVDCQPQPLANNLSRNAGGRQQWPWQRLHRIQQSRRRQACGSRKQEFISEL